MAWTSMAMTYTTPDAMMAAASHVERNYVHGCVVTLEAASFEGAAFGVLAPDGARFRIVADRFGNVARALDGEWFAESLDRLQRETDAALAEICARR